MKKVRNQRPFPFAASYVAIRSRPVRRMAGTSSPAKAAAWAAMGRSRTATSALSLVATLAQPLNIVSIRADA